MAAAGTASVPDVLPSRARAGAAPRRLPPPLDEGALLQAVGEALRSRNAKIAVIDDDPTGTQTVSGIPIVTAWDEPELRWAIETADPLFAILTNTRAVAEARAVELNRTIGERLAQLAQRHGVEILAISRSDSTLRGHFPGETEALAAGLSSRAAGIDAVVVCPAFPQAGRVTVDDVHLVRIGDALVPAAETEYARDPVFGYRESNLVDWVRARVNGDAGVVSIGLDDVRLGGPDRIAARLLDAAGEARFVVANAAAQADLAALALGIEQAERTGMRVVCRTGPSFLGARAGRATPDPLTDGQLAAEGPGLVVVGSHTELTTAQLRAAARRHGLVTVELDVGEVLAGRTRAADAVARSTASLRATLSGGGDAILATTRTPVESAVGLDGLELSRAIADAVVSVVSAVVAQVRVGWVVAKGGVTSHDVAVRALRVRRARVLGQVFPGQVSVWELGEGSVRAGTRYVVFPGNVGDEHALATVLDRLRRRP